MTTLPGYSIKTFEDEVEGLPPQVEEFFSETLPDSRAELPADRPDRDAWRTLLTCAVSEGGSVLGGIHMDVGPVTFGPRGADTVGILEEVFVQAECRRKGVGTAVLQGALEAARDLGCRHVRCSVPWDAPAAIALYLRCGFALPCLGEGEYFAVKPLQA
jgi:GNAT superfamily N-acetyltransferase